MNLARKPKTRSTRKSVQHPGWLILEGSFAARPCTVLDMSDSGARIEVSDPGAVPAKLRLAFSRDVRTGRACEVAWQRGRTIGVKFI
jgi:PilZ domain